MEEKGEIDAPIKDRPNGAWTRLRQHEETMMRLLANGFLCFAVLCLMASFGQPVLAHDDEVKEKSSKIADDKLPLVDPESFPTRPKPILELGGPLLGSGNIDPGFELPTGAVWQPALTVYGGLRSAIQTFDDGTKHTSEWVNRFDLMANLQLSGTERLLVGIRPLDQNGRFSGHVFSPNSENGGVDALNGNISTLFFEGDIGEIFPSLDLADNRALDLGFAVGRQPFTYQEGMLINDTMDSLGVIRNTLLPTGGSDLQLTFLWAWNEINRNDNREDPGASLYGLFVGADFDRFSANLDVVYVDGGDYSDGVYLGLSSVQRLGHFNTSFRLLASRATGQESAAVSDGYLLFGEVSWTPPWTRDNVYVNAFWGIDAFSSAARGPSAGGPLGRVGILYEAVGIGQFAAPLGDRPDDSAGGAVGYQLFMADTRKQLIFEAAARQAVAAGNRVDYGIGARYQQALGQRWVVRLDAFVADRSALGTGWGTRMEWSVQF